MNKLDVARDPWRGVHNAIRDSILAGEFGPGERLVEQQLADQFGTSRGPVRTALQELERTGLVVSIDRRGTFVRSLSDSDMEEIFSLTAMLSEFAIRRAIERIGPEDREWLKSFKARVAKVKDPEQLLELYVEYGRRLFEMAAHRRALEIHESLLIQTQARAVFTMAIEHMGDWKANGVLTLRKSCDALIRGDAEKAIEQGTRLLNEIHERWKDGAESAAGAETGS